MAGYPYYMGSFFEEKKPQLTYILTTPNSALAVSLAEVKVQARIASAIISEDTYLTSLIYTATKIAEDYTGRDILTKTYTAYMDYFPRSPCEGILLERGILGSVTSIKYLSSGVLTTVAPATYYTTLNPAYSSIYLSSGYSWPGDVDVRKQAVQIAFTAGYGATESSVPAGLIQALLQNITTMYQARGDSGDGGFDDWLSATALGLYDQFRIFKV